MKKILLIAIALLLLTWCNQKEEAKKHENIEILEEKVEKKDLVKNRIWNDVTECYHIYWDLWLYFSTTSCSKYYMWHDRVITKENWMAWNDWKYEKKFYETDSFWGIIFTAQRDRSWEVDKFNRIWSTKQGNKFKLPWWDDAWESVRIYWDLISLDWVIYDQDFDNLCIEIDRVHYCWLSMVSYWPWKILSSWDKRFFYRYWRFQQDSLNRLSFDEIEVYEDDSFRTVSDWIPTLSYIFNKNENN